MPLGVVPCAASSLVAGLLEQEGHALVEVARTGVSVHYETALASLPVLCLAMPEAVRLPNSVVARELPPQASLHRRVGLRVSGGMLVETGTSGGRTWRVARWWRPERPVRLSRPSDGSMLRRLALVVAARTPSVLQLPRPSYDGLVPAALIGAGPGLTPLGDDVLAGALVTAHATADPRLPDWRRATAAALERRRTTAVSRALLHHALAGHATTELAGFLRALCGNSDVEEPLARLLAVGHTSGAGLLAGVVHTLATSERQEAA